MAESASSPDRALRALADTLAGARARTPDDASDSGIPTAATVVMVRDGADGVEVLLIERPDRGSFAGAWVFPGGKIEDADRLGVDEPEEAVARLAGVRETREETGLVLDSDVLVTLSCWDPPPGIALRIRTWFFAASAPGGSLLLAADEAIAAEWVRPGDVLARHGRGEVTLYPPTWVTLHALTGHDEVESILASGRLGGIERYETIARRGAEGPILLWDGDAEYDPAAPVEASGSGVDSARHRLEIGALPWRYTRSG